MTADTLFEAASLGKPVFAYGVHKLVRDGDLDLDMALSSYLDRPYIEGDERIHLITARHVLSHSAGFPNWRPRRWSKSPGPLKIIYDPGTRFRYSGEGYNYLQSVVEQITKLTLDEFMVQSVHAPLEIASSAWTWPNDLDAPLALPHGPSGQAKTKNEWAPMAAGSLHTTAADLGRFLEAILTEAKAGGADPGLLSAEEIEAMLQPQISLEDDIAWSLGWGIELQSDRALFWQWGDNDTYHHFMIGSRTEGRAIVVLTNGQRGPHVYKPIIEMVLGHGLVALTHVP
jgi:CubicO group peptidase (beta-lactamase class C family)